MGLQISSLGKSVREKLISPSKKSNKVLPFPHEATCLSKPPSILRSFFNQGKSRTKSASITLSSVKEPL